MCFPQRRRRSTGERCNKFSRARKCLGVRVKRILPVWLLRTQFRRADSPPEHKLAFNYPVLGDNDRKLACYMRRSAHSGDIGERDMIRKASLVIALLAATA